MNGTSVAAPEAKIAGIFQKPSGSHVAQVRGYEVREIVRHGIGSATGHLIFEFIRNFVLPAFLVGITWIGGSTFTRSKADTEHNSQIQALKDQHAEETRAILADQSKRDQKTQEQLQDNANQILSLNLSLKALVDQLSKPLPRTERADVPPAVTPPAANPIVPDVRDIQTSLANAQQVHFGAESLNTQGIQAVQLTAIAVPSTGSHDSQPTAVRLDASRNVAIAPPDLPKKLIWQVQFGASRHIAAIERRIEVDRGGTVTVYLAGTDGFPLDEHDTRVIVTENHGRITLSTESDLPHHRVSVYAVLDSGAHWSSDELASVDTGPLNTSHPD